MLHLRSLALLWCLPLIVLLPSQAQAILDAAPPHSLSPILNGLNLNTMVKKDRIKIALYVINFEAFPVVCDAEYRSGPDIQNAGEITVAPNKIGEFRFNYGRSGDNVLLELMCIDPAKPASTPPDPTETTPRP